MKASSSVETLLDALFSALGTSTELAGGILRERPADQLQKAAAITHFRAALAFGVLYDLLEADDLPAELEAGLRARLRLEPGKAERARADADQAAVMLEHLHNGTATVISDLSKLERVKA